MGYYTAYEFTKVEQAPQAKCPHCDQPMPGYVAFADLVGQISGYAPTFEDPVKWYDHEQHVAQAMVDTGTTLVVLHGVGEEQGDVWDKTFTLDGGIMYVETAKYGLKRNTGVRTTLTTKARTQ